MSDDRETPLAASKVLSYQGVKTPTYEWAVFDALLKQLGYAAFPIIALLPIGLKPGSCQLQPTVGIEGLFLQFGNAIKQRKPTRFCGSFFRERQQHLQQLLRIPIKQCQAELIEQLRHCGIVTPPNQGM